MDNPPIGPQIWLYLFLVFLPRFKLEQGLSLNTYLQTLGMKDAFDENATDFSGMSKTFLYITQVIHKAFPVVFCLWGEWLIPKKIKVMSLKTAR